MDREKVIKELTNLPTTIYDGLYQLRITHDLRNKVISLLKEQEAEIENLKQTAQSMMEGLCLLKKQEAETELCDRCGRRRVRSDREVK